MLARYCGNSKGAGSRKPEAGTASRSSRSLLSAGEAPSSTSRTYAFTHTVVAGLLRACAGMGGWMPVVRDGARAAAPRAAARARCARPLRRWRDVGVADPGAAAALYKTPSVVPASFR